MLDENIFRINSKNDSLHSSLYIRCDEPEADIYEAKRIINTEYSKYPSFIKKTKLQVINIVSNLRVKNNNEIDKFVTNSSTVDPVSKWLYINIDFLCNKKYFCESLHHEIWHLYDFSTFGTFTPKDQEWEKLNPVSFKYGAGGWFAYHNEFNNYFHPLEGFITSYSTLGIDEDKAELFMYYNSTHLQKKLINVIKEDEIIKNKLKIIKTAAFN